MASSNARWYSAARRALALPTYKVKQRQIVAAVAKALGVAVPSGKDARAALVRQFAVQRGESLAYAKQRRNATLPDVARTTFLQSYEWRALRMLILKKRGARCECCGATPADGTTIINVDHIKPRRDFPELALEESNLQVLCDACNHGKGNWDQTDWRAESQPVAPGPRLIKKVSA
jgi:5-methylcytosine-specific restriction endonuclease McrA